MATNFRVKMGEIGRIIFYSSPSHSKTAWELGYRRPDFKSFIFDDLATFYANLVNFDLVTLEFKNGKCVQLLVSFLLNKPF